ncbi:Gfo/Idh/MocA family protein [Pantoea sp. Aalb]|uniref:Gfo/Idh/MocA family oxidoreductase n=1 Tax=Pantoea sp. Aalb TaxID=2576762 RepID=UPI00132350D4|nr:Gfo/Idh/MocA family oxidoreductase [Pantoea sp. Aalb]MXP67857.1 Gfo/Idh/MocA family oxidoreductase [Pantoea sp. Aalb]
MALKLGVIGIGTIGQEHIHRCNNILQDVKIVAVSDINVEVAHNVLNRLKIDAKVYQNSNHMINSPEVDAILVTSSDSTHEQFVLNAISIGKSVFCEKPLAMNAEGCLKIINTEMEKGKRLVQVGFMRQYDPGYCALKKVITDGKIGKPLILHCAHRNENVDKNYTTEAVITNTLIHELDILRWLIEDNYKTVQVIFPRTTSNSHANLRDPQIFLLETQKGIRIDVEIFVNCSYGYDIQCEVVGEDGIARLPEPSTVQMRKNNLLSTMLFTHWKDRFIDAYNIELQSFINGVKNEYLTGPSAWDGFAASIAADACLKAQNSGDIEIIKTLPCPIFYN